MTERSSDRAAEQSPSGGRADCQGGPPDGQGGPADGRHPGTDNVFDTLRRIDMRRSDEGWIGGVGAGLATRLGVDPVVIRAGLIMLGLFFGIGVTLYLIAWLLIPDRHNRTHLERGMRHREGASILLLVVAALAMVTSLPWGGGGWFGGAWFGGWFGWWLAALVVLAAAGWALWTAWQSREGPGRVAEQGRYAAPPPPPGTGTGSSSQAWHDSGRTERIGQSGPGRSSLAPGGPPAPGVPARDTTTSGARRRRRSGGPAAALLSTGLALATFGALVWAGGAYGWPGNVQSVAVAGALGVLGLCLLALGLAGRRGGIPGLFAGLVLVATVAVAPLPPDFELSGRAGQQTWRPTAAAEAEDYLLDAGEGRLDLTRLDPAELDGQTLEASVGVGALRVTVPDDVTVRVVATCGMGEISLLDDSPVDSLEQRTGGFSVAEDVVLGPGEADLVLEVHVGIGQITVERD